MSRTFAAAVIQILRPDLNQYGFHSETVDSDTVTFQNAEVRFVITRERGSCAVDLILRRNSEALDRYNIPEIAAWNGASVPHLIADDAASTDDCLRWLHDFVTKDCRELLIGKDAAFLELDAAARRHDERYTRSMMIKSALVRARVAHDRGDFAEVLRLLSAYEDEIDEEYSGILRDAREKAR